MALPVDELNGRTIPLQGYVGAGGGPGAPGNVLVNTARVDLYVSDVNGNDANNGLAPATPVKTLAGALSKITFQVVAFDIVIHVGAHAGAGYTWATIDGYTLIDGASIYVYGDGAGQVGEDGFTEVLASTAALAGSSDQVIVGAAMVADTYRGNTLEVLTGAAAGDRRTLGENTAVNLLPLTRFTAAVGAGDTYRILRPSVVIALPAIASGTVICAGISPSIHGGVAVTTSGATSAARSALVLVNLRVGAASSALLMYESLVQMFGVEYYGGIMHNTGELDFGVTSYLRADLAALVATSTAWHGWTVSQVASGGTILFLFGDAIRRGVYAGKTVSLGDGNFDFYAGRLLAAGSTGLSVGLNNGNIPFCLLGTYGLVSTAYLGVKIDTTTGKCINISMGRVSCPNLGATAPVTLISSGGGTGILVDHASVLDMLSQHNFASGFSLTTAGWGVSVKRGGRALVDHDMRDGIVATLGDFTLDEVVGYDFPAGTQPGFFIAAPDGSAIISVD